MYMKKILFSCVTLSALLMVPLVTSAQIVPDCGAGCGWSELIEMAKNILDFIVMLAITASALMFAYAGWLFFSDTGNASNVEKGKKIFGAVVVGLIIVLVAWLVVNTILVTLTGKGLDERVNSVSSATVDRYDAIV